MNQRTTSTQAMAETAARARIEEMSSPWALGDYDRFARELVWDLGPELVEACAIGPGQRVLDVAAGTGNVALRAAQAGAQVVASDVTRESLAVGERNARELGLEMEWVQADAQALPFANGEFDVVTSAVGAIFAPDHQAVADELLRVCRPGGMIGMVNFTPEGNAADFFGASPLRAGAAAWCAAAGPVGQRGTRARALRQPRRLARHDPTDVRGAPARRPARVLRLHL
jgi:ubiquinone/menaquinone biosynthesis C-methylase UbiE